MRGFSEQLDWTLDGVGVTVISAETTNGAIKLEGSAQDKVIVRAFKRVHCVAQTGRREICEESSRSRRATRTRNKDLQRASQTAMGQQRQCHL